MRAGCREPCPEQFRRSRRAWVVFSDLLEVAPRARRQVDRGGRTEKEIWGIRQLVLTKANIAEARSLAWNMLRPGQPPPIGGRYRDHFEIDQEDVAHAAPRLGPRRASASERSFCRSSALPSGFPC